MMLDSRDPAIKLFGKTIPLPEHGMVPTLLADHVIGEEDKDLLNKEATTKSNDQGIETPNSEEKSELPTSSRPSETQKPSSAGQETATVNTLKPEEQQSDTNNSQEKLLKKPDKILPCPRCNSLDTKFCYYNNYNVNQPRHFCKKCQRYWTAGGTMRNVPVGAGRRKNKNCASLYRHMTIPDTNLQTVRSELPHLIHHPPPKPNGTVLSFGSDVPLCDSMSSVLNLPEKTMQNCNRNGFQGTEEHMVPFSCGVENGNEHSSGSSLTPLNSNVGTGANIQGPAIQNCQGFPPQIPCYNGSPWPYPWSPAPAFCNSSFPIQFYPATAYWGCAVPGSWSVPWLPPLASSSPNMGSSGSGSNSPNLGKHSREGNMLKQDDMERGDTLKPNNQERCLWIPKTLRIDDPDQAAKSSIWATMGFKNDNADAISSRGIFKAFQPKVDIKNHSADASQVLHANPAALSRSLNFQEGS